MAKAKTKAVPSKFAAWWRLQAGPRQYSGEFAKLDDAALVEVIDAGHRAAYEYQRRVRWDERKTYALYAWTARRSDSSAEERT